MPRRNPYGWTFCPIVCFFSAAIALWHRRFFQSLLLFLLGRFLSCRFLGRSLLLGRRFLHDFPDWLLGWRAFLHCLPKAGFTSATRLFFQCNLHVGDTPLIVVGTTHRSRSNTLHARPIVGNGALHVKPAAIDIQTFFRTRVVGILDGRTQQLVQLRSDALLGVQQRVQSLFHPAALDQV